jgi:hypothetical protein
VRLNLGAGLNKIPGYVNVDREAVAAPDVLWDLEQAPWPWPDNSVTEVLACHVFEHLGETTSSWLKIMKELWRVCAHDARVFITVPHPRHDNFLSDSTHIRAITPQTFAMFDQMHNIREHEAGGGESRLGLYNGVDLEVLRAGFELTEPWRTEYMANRLSGEQVSQAIGERNNVCYEIRIEARIIKPLRGLAWLEEQAKMREMPFAKAPKPSGGMTWAPV